MKQKTASKTRSFTLSETSNEASKITSARSCHYSIKECSKSFSSSKAHFR